MTSAPASIRVLIVDDSPSFLAALRALLSGSPAIEVVATATDGVAAVAANARHRPELVVMDVRMPRMTGREAAKVMRKTSPRPRIMLISVGPDVCADESLHRECDSFVPKIGLHKVLWSEIERLFPRVRGYTRAGSRGGAAE